MKMAELGGNVLVSCIIDFDDAQLCLRQFCLNLNICKVMTIFFKFWPKKIRKTVIDDAQDDAQEAVVPVRGFLQTTQSKMRKWEIWLPSPWEVRPTRGGLGGNKEFE